MLPDYMTSSPVTRIPDLLRTMPTIYFSKCSCFFTSSLVRIEYLSIISGKAMNANSLSLISTKGTSSPHWVLNRVFKEIDDFSSKVSSLSDSFLWSFSPLSCMSVETESFTWLGLGMFLNMTKNLSTFFRYKILLICWELSQNSTCWMLYCYWFDNLSFLDRMYCLLEV